MTANERIAGALQEVRQRIGQDGFREQLRAEARLLKDHPSSAEGNTFLEAVLADLAEELERLEGSREGEPAP
jgi:hypothetical protein